MFEYPTEAHVRRHGPRGYYDYQSFKPWLRDEFDFRCVYCLWREIWSADGHAAFSIDHLKPRTSYPELMGDYSNLVYACSRCNSLKQDLEPPLDPCADGYGNHVEVQDDGCVVSKTTAGNELIELCRLNRPALVQARQRLIQTMALLKTHPSAEAQQLLVKLRGFPSELPILSALNPPGGNSRPSGIERSYFVRRQRNELALTQE